MNIKDYGYSHLIGLMTSQSPNLLIGLFGILKSGHGFVPIDPEYPMGRIDFMVKDCELKILVTEEKYLDKAHQISENNSFLEHIICIDSAKKESAEGRSTKIYDYNAYAKKATVVKKRHFEPGQFLYVIYTSGSTGTPKGVPICHENLVPLLLWSKEYFNFDADTKTLQNLSYCFDFGVFEILTTLLFGGKLFFIDKEELVRPLQLTQFVNDNSINTLHTTPSFFKELLSLGVKLDSLETLHLGGENLTKDTANEIFKVIGDDCVLYNGYGPTEASVNSCIFEVGTRSTFKNKKDTVIPIGKPSANNFVFVLDKHHQPVPIGVPGELHVGGVGLTSGYLNQPELTAEKFTPDPFTQKPGSRLYKTGDMVHFLPDGNIEFLGRIDHQVKIRGFRIELGEIEAILGQHPNIRETVVLAIEDELGQRRIVAYLAIGDGLGARGQGEKELTVSELRSFLQEKLPDYMIPSAFVFLEKLPLTPNGKVDRKALPAPEKTRPTLEETYVAPRTPAEEILSGIFAQVLGIEKVGLNDNFFELGGHSLLATQVISRMRESFQLDLPLRTLFESPAVANLGQAVAAAQLAGKGLESPPLRPTSREGEIPLSFAQERLWFLSQLDSSPNPYHPTAAVRLTGSLNLDSLEKSLTEIVRRHEALRTSFAVSEGRPIQRIHPLEPFHFKQVDFSGMSQDDGEREILRLVEERTRQSFDLEHLLFRDATLVKISEDEHVVLFTAHHIFYDGWSVAVFMHELSTLYEAFSQGKASPLQELHIQYADFARWQRDWLQGEVLEGQLAYWKERLRDCPPILDLPTDRPRPPVQTDHGAAQEFSLPAPLCRSLKALSQQEGTSLFMTLLAAFQTLLSRHSGQEDICIGTPIANRTRAEVEPLIGYFLNHLVLRTDLSGTPTFKELLRQVREVTLGAYAHQDLPFEKLLDALQIERSLSHTPLFQVMFIFQNMPAIKLNLSGITLSPLEFGSVGANFDLTLEMQEAGEELIGSLTYNSDLFDPATISRMVVHFEMFLQAIVTEPTKKISELPILTESERSQLLFEWNDTQRNYPQDRCIPQLFEAQVQRSPDNMAIVFEERELTYRELNAKANQLAHHLRDLGVGPEVLVGICVDRSLEMMIGLLGILKSGGVYVPLEPNYPKERLEHLLSDTKVPVMLTQGHLRERLPQDSCAVICLDTDWENISKKGKTNPRNEIAPENLAYVIYTSGSTGQPKGVGVPHRAIVNYIASACETFSLTQNDRVLQFASISFDAAAEEIFPTLLSGATLVLRNDRMLESTEQFFNTCQDWGITVLDLPTAYWHELIASLSNKLDIPASIRLVILGGERALPERLKAWRKLIGTHPKLLNTYGPTEATVVATICDLSQSDFSDDYVGEVPIGRPVQNAQVYILDQYLNQVPIGILGELYIGGEGLARGYLNHPEFTQEKFIPHLFSQKQGLRLYKTGDRARYLSDGKIEFLGRLDDQVKVRGFRIELGEIDSVLRKIPGVQEVALRAIEEEVGETKLVAYLVTQQPGEAWESEIRKFLKGKLPEHMIPSNFVFLEKLPLTNRGKVDKQALSLLGKVRQGSLKAHVEPRDIIEAQLRKIWEDLLDKRPIGVKDNFFDLGGHSMLAIRLFARIRKLTGRDLPLVALFEEGTIEHLAGLIRAQPVAERPSLVVLQREGGKQPFFCVHPVGGNVFCYYALAQLIGSDQPFYGLQSRSLDGQKESDTEIEKMATRYIQEIRTVQACGPYHLGGWSMGGMIAYEMARQLKEAGEEISLLAMIDSHPIFDESLKQLKEKELLPLFAEYLAGLSEISFLREDYIKLPEDRQLDYLLEQAKKTALMPPDLGVSDLRQLFEIFKNNLKAIWGYRPKKYSGHVIFFEPADDQTEPAEENTFDWSRVVTGEVEIKKIPGDHYTILTEPNVQVLAESLKACLNEIFEQETMTGGGARCLTLSPS